MNCQIKISHNKNMFDEAYFKTQNYTNYLERELRYKKMAQELTEYLKTNYSIQSSKSRLLDFGCAVGFLVKGIRGCGHYCDGYDISEWAKEQASQRGIKFIPFVPAQFDAMFALDVFEHMSDKEIEKALSIFDSRLLITRIPCSTDGGKTYHLDVSKKDPTHINCKTKKQWIDFFSLHGYASFERLDLYTIYDTDGVMCYLYRKDK